MGLLCPEPHSTVGSECLGNGLCLDSSGMKHKTLRNHSDTYMDSTEGNGSL